MIDGRTEIKKAFISGTTRRVQFQIVDKETGVGFQPSTLILSIYDVIAGSTTWQTCQCPYLAGPWSNLLPAVTSSLVNGQNDVDISAFVDALGYVDIYLTPEDTTIEVPSYVSAKPYQRMLLFTWTWGSPPKVGKLEIQIAIAADRETVAS